MLLSYNQIVSRFIHILKPFNLRDLVDDGYNDEEDMEAMISDVSGYLQVELYKLGRTLIVYSSDGFPKGENTIIGTPHKTRILPAFDSQCIYPRTPVYTIRKSDNI